MAAWGTTRYFFSSKVISTAAFRKNIAWSPTFACIPFAARIVVSNLPGLVVETAQVGNGSPRPGGHDESGLHLLGVDRGGRQVEADLGAVIAVLRSDEHPVADYEELPGRKFHRQ